MSDEIPRGLNLKLATIMGEMRGIKKEGFNAAQHYKFVRETDVAEKASELFAKYHVWVEQNVASWDIKDLYRTQSGLTMRLCEVTMEFRFVDADTNETGPTRTFPGHGADTGDKAIYKAMTGAEKYFLMKSFFVSTGDDPEADEKTDKAAAATEAAASGPTVVGPTVRRGTTGRGGRGGKQPMATSAQITEIARLAKDLDLDAESVVPVISRVLETGPGEHENLREWLSSISSDQAGAIITAMMAMKTLDATIGEPEGVEAMDPADMYEGQEEGPQTGTPLV